MYKYQNLCETNDPINFKEKIDKKFLNIDSIKKKMNSGKDIIGRDDDFVKIKIDNNFPKFLTDNINKYSDWIE